MPAESEIVGEMSSDLGSFASAQWSPVAEGDASPKFPFC